MVVLLTGATGFVGSRVLRKLIARGARVRVFAEPGTAEDVSDHDLDDLVIGQLADRKALAEATRGVSLVYHLAALLPGSDPEELEAVNVRGTENLLCACEAARVRRFVFASSVSVYDRAPRPVYWPIDESYPLRTSGAGSLRRYAQSKIDAESAILRSRAGGGPEYVILRAAAVYGPKADWVEKLLKRAIEEASRPGARVSGLASMQWVHVQDLARALILAGRLARAGDQILNIAGDELFSMRDLVQIANHEEGDERTEMPGSPSRLCPGDYGLRYDISRARAVLGYTPHIKLEEGLKRAMTARVDRTRVSGGGLDDEPQHHGGSNGTYPSSGSPPGGGGTGARHRRKRE
jgi:nucleoside-diphosphate-sugar epimerase